jgi:hypothetical protein
MVGVEMETKHIGVMLFSITLERLKIQAGQVGRCTIELLGKFSKYCTTVLPYTAIIFINYSAEFRRISATTRTVKFGRTFCLKLVGFWLIWVKFSHSKLRSANFRAKSNCADFG